MKHPMLKLMGLRRQEPKTRLGRIARRGEYAVCIIIVMYLFIQLFPQVLFANSVHVHGLQVYSTEPLSRDVEPILLAIQNRIATSTLHQENETCTVFVCNSRWLYTFFRPTSRSSFGGANIFTRRIFVADADLGHNLARRFGGDYSTRSFTSVVVHEAGHILLRHRLGILATWTLPTWLQEGYGEMIAGESSFPENTGDSLLARGGENGSTAFRYFTYRRMVEYLTKEKNITIEELARSKPNAELVRKETCDWIRNKNIEQPHASDGEERRR